MVETVCILQLFQSIFNVIIVDVYNYRSATLSGRDCVQPSIIINVIIFIAFLLINIVQK